MKTFSKFFAAGLIVLLAACGKKEITPLSHSSIPIEVALSSTVIPPDPASNKQNPFDYFGYYHNIGLDSLRHYVKANNDTTRRGKYAYISSYFKLNFGEVVTPVYNPNEKLACTNYKALWLNQKVSVTAKGYWQALSDATQSIKDLDHYDAFKQQIIAIENHLLADKLSADEKKNLLITASILRYSGYYWINAFRNGEVVAHEQGRGLAMPDSFLRKIAGVITGICADASVVAAGYISGDYGIIGEAYTWSEICGYYTGWW